MPININLYSDLDLALMCICGYLGSGTARKKKLGDRYAAVQRLVNQITRGSMPAPSKGQTKEELSKRIRSLMPTEADIDSFIEEVIDGC